MSTDSLKLASSLVSSKRTSIDAMTLSDLVKILHQSFPHDSPLALGQVILKPTVCPHTSRTEMAAALSSEKDFAESDVLDAVDSLYPVDVTVQSTRAWQETGVMLTGRLSTRIACTGGRWTANPDTGLYGASGSPLYTAKPGYTLPGAPEGALVGRVGGNAPFLVGDGAQAPAGQAGMLSLCINDDLDGVYGVGLSDNEGTVSVHISCA